MSFGKNLFVFVSGAVVGAGALAGFAGWQMYKALKKNDVLYTAVRSSVDAGVKAASSEFSEHGAKAVLNMVFGKRGVKAHTLSYVDSYNMNHRRSRGYDIDCVYFDSREMAKNVIDSLTDILNQYGQVTVGDFYDAAGLGGCYYSANQYGWKNFDKVRIKQEYRDRQWYIDFPDPIKLE